ncbi:MAG TPA: 50S ribosomal protein L29 [Candidatus Thermoplasmatota archaeon]|nr:50S ribosomal protein L29 [Candidatus Thermoplasmatota archaeon]
MALKTKEIRNLSAEEREARLKEARSELMNERGVAAMGGAPRNPGKIRDLRRDIARLMTVTNEAGAQ